MPIDRPGALIPDHERRRGCGAAGRPFGVVVTTFRSPGMTGPVRLPGMPDVTHPLTASEAGAPRAAADLLPLVYDELRRLAAARLAAERPGQTLQLTALVHEAYLRLVGSDAASLWNGRGTSSPRPPRRCAASSSTAPASGWPT